jgi:hypothetical protein
MAYNDFTMDGWWKYGIVKTSKYGREVKIPKNNDLFILILLVGIVIIEY